MSCSTLASSFTGKAVAVPCAACYSRFKTGAHDIEDPETAADVRAVVGRAYDGGVTVQNLVDVYHDAVGVEKLAAKVTRPFSGLKIACYCLLYTSDAADE